MPPRSRKTTRPPNRRRQPSLAKVATGIDGFDEITGGGLPHGRPTLVCGGPGCGKTLFGLEFLVHGAARGESGVFVTFEETEDDIVKNVRVARLRPRRSRSSGSGWRIEYIRVERSEIEETGEYDLEGAVHPPGPRPALDRRAPNRPRHDRIAVRRAQQRRRAARRAAPAVRLAEGARHHGGHHRRARRRHADASGPRGVRLRLRHRARPSRHRSDLDAPAAHREIPRLEPRHERISVPDRSARHRRAAGHLAPADPHGDVRADLDRPRLARRDVRRQGLFPGQQRADVGRRRHRQDEPRRAISWMRPAGAASARSVFSSRSRRRSTCATCDRSAWISTAG